MSNPIFNKFLSKGKSLSPVPVKIQDNINKDLLLNQNGYSDDNLVIDNQQMSVTGTINKTLIIFSCLLFSAVLTFSSFMTGFTDRAHLLTIGGLFVSVILAFVIIFSKNVGCYKYLTPIYALAEGCLLGGISAFFEASIAGLVAQAIIATLATVFTMLLLFRAGLIRATEKFRSVIFTATLSIGAIYLIQIIATLFSRSIPLIFEANPVGIGFSVLVVGVAALNLINDFDFIEKGAQYGLNKEYEWYGAFGLMVTIVWLYVEILHLLAKIAASRD